MRLQKKNLVMVNDRLEFLYQFTDALSDEICDNLISKFEKSDNLLKRDNNGYPNFTELEISYDSEIIKITKDVLDLYVSLLNPYGDFFLSKKKCFEGFRIKKYFGGTEDRFDMHVDVSNKEVSGRYLAFLYYLNDGYCGGKTVFYPNHVITPIKGSVLVFPPYWMYPHEGQRVISGNKYIMSTYLHWGD